MINAKHDKLFTRLCEKYYRSVVYYFLRMGFVKETSQDLAQEVFVRIFRGLGQYQGDAEWEYILTTARHLALNERRSRNTQKRSAQEVSLDTMDYDLPFNPLTGELSKSPEVELIERELETEHRRLLREEIKKLSPEIRDCLLLYLSGLKYREISRVMRITLDAVKSRLNEARNLLKAGLKEERE